MPRNVLSVLLPPVPVLFPPVPEVHRNSPVPAVALSFLPTPEVPPGSSSHTWFPGSGSGQAAPVSPEMPLRQRSYRPYIRRSPWKDPKEGNLHRTARHGSPSIPRQMPSHHRSHGTPATPHRRTPRHMPVKDSQRSVWHWKTA